MKGCSQECTRIAVLYGTRGHLPFGPPDADPSTIALQSVHGRSLTTQSKYRHVYGTKSKVLYENAKVSGSAWDTDLVTASEVSSDWNIGDDKPDVLLTDKKYIAVNWQVSGGGVSAMQRSDPLRDGRLSYLTPTGFRYPSFLLPVLAPCSVALPD